MINNFLLKFAKKKGLICLCELKCMKKEQQIFNYIFFDAQLYKCLIKIQIPFLYS